MKIGITTRVEPKDLETAKKLKIDIPELFRETLKKAIFKGTGKCPKCGQEIKK